MADQILMTDVAGYVTYAKDGVGEIQAFGNFPNCYETFDSPRNFHPAARPGITFTGQFVFVGADVSEGQQVLFDIAADGAFNKAVNVRVP